MVLLQEMRVYKEPLPALADVVFVYRLAAHALVVHYTSVQVLRL